MHPFFICGQDEINLKLTTLTKTGVSDNGWTQHYVDQITNEEWLLTQFHAEYHGGGVSVLKRLPKLTTEELIDIAVTSPDTNDIIGASIELSEKEKYNQEDFRNKLLQRLLQFDISNLTNFDKERLKTIIYESTLYDATNRRDIMRKHFTEIDTDAKYYQTVAEQAKTILADIDKYSSKHMCLLRNSHPVDKDSFQKQREEVI